MELSSTTFVWLRTVGCLGTTHVVPGRTKGMIALTTDGVQQLVQGKSIVLMLHHYCCDRFDVPEQLQPNGEITIQGRRRNWSIVSKILADALDYELSWDRRELVIQGDVVEVVVLLRQIQDLVQTLRVRDTKKKSQRAEEEVREHIRFEKGLMAKPLLQSAAQKREQRAAQLSEHEKHKPWLEGISQKQPPADVTFGRPKRAPKVIKPRVPNFVAMGVVKAKPPPRDSDGEDDVEVEAAPPASKFREEDL
jgi:hypothetical protein